MKSKSFEIALSGVATAIASVALIIASYVSALMGACLILACVAMMIPLSKKIYLGGFLAYLASSIIAVLCGGFVLFYRVFPFMAFMGLHPLVNAIFEKFKLNKYIALAIKTVWFDIAVYCFYLLFVYFALGGDISSNKVLSLIQPYLWAVIIFACSLFFILYDTLIKRCQVYVDKIVERIKTNKTGN